MSSGGDSDVLVESSVSGTIVLQHLLFQQSSERTIVTNETFSRWARGYIISARSLEITMSSPLEGPRDPPLLLSPINPLMPILAISERVSFGTTPIKARLTLIGLSN
jgi:hypothetical protein